MPRFSVQKHYPAMQPLLALSMQVHDCGRLEPALQQLVLMRVSQINGCAFCLDMHSKDARAGGETEQRLSLLPAWRETTLYSERAQAALAWAKKQTKNEHGADTDALCERARAVLPSRV